MKEKIRTVLADTWSLLSSRTGLLILLGLVCGIVGLIVEAPVLWTAVWISAFTAFDIYVYPSIKASEDRAYRIGQSILWLFLSLAVYKQSGWVAVRSAWLFWYFLGCDYLYIWMRDEALRIFTYWDLNVFVFFFKYIKKQEGAPIPWANASAVIGLLLLIASLLFA